MTKEKFLTSLGDVYSVAKRAHDVSKIRKDEEWVRSGMFKITIEVDKILNIMHKSGAITIAEISEFYGSIV